MYLLTSVHNNADDADATDNANNYNRVIGKHCQRLSAVVKIT